MSNDNYFPYDDISKEDEFENPIEEKWVVAYIKSDTLKRIYYRQFYAVGFYEAYDRVMTFTEKTNYKILWYKEKRKCGIYFAQKEIPYLEFICTFCNIKFNNVEPIKCNFEKKNVCGSEFCSSYCKQEHFYYVHVRRKK
ncbi:MAG: hypothetical protein H0X03_02005 [Nitrosopumilus sp.]|nr:hypothetical protein [Nitrosopumilus sp.]